jgi:hypothetical protein
LKNPDFTQNAPELRRWGEQTTQACDMAGYSFDALILERSLLALPHRPLMLRPATLLLSRKREKKEKWLMGQRNFSGLGIWRDYTRIDLWRGF